MVAGRRVPASYVSRDMVEAGLRMSYGTNIQERLRQVGSHAGTILRGTKPADPCLSVHQVRIRSQLTNR